MEVNNYNSINFFTDANPYGTNILPVVGKINHEGNHGHTCHQSGVLVAP
jgi:hypothetical protein